MVGSGRDWGRRRERYEEVRDVRVEVDRVVVWRFPLRDKTSKV